MKKQLLLISILLLSACASIVSGTQQVVSVKTEPESKCTLLNDKGTWYTNAPGTVTVHRAMGNMNVTCKSQTSTGSAEIKSDWRGLMAGNIVWGWLVPVGVAVDMGTGAGFDYPSPIEVPLNTGK